MGYGAKALQLLGDYFEGKFANIDENSTWSNDDKYALKKLSDEDLENATLKDKIEPRKEDKLPPLFINLSHKAPYYLDYLGVSYGLTPQLFKFWKKSEFVPVYLRQTSNDLTGEHTCVMLKVLPNRNEDWLKSFSADFHKRFMNLLSYNFSKFPSVQSLTLMDAVEKYTEKIGVIFKKLD
ncbi:unnamed protein product [Ambrosiozyma monospora]|uniref:Unnamed protein product n=1 Tax=Ambrosiozyma monospora TaxID=43982 RepID=A0ACB5UDH2_AMBMO|nr:unnamed protein product [Ambrosiozyma monospora]